MSEREYLKIQIDRLPDGVIKHIQEYVSFQLYSLGMFDNDTDYLNSIPGMADMITQGLATPISECFEDLE
ncbi:hypothetical protein AGMMS49957_00770 [Synergistales bacterium]|nr:hypothetical protein AGMMS49957_00770 [Synergistales bacterium]